jgi:zinc transporter ZupT
MLRMVLKGKAFGGHDQHPHLKPLLFRCIVKRMESAFYWGLVATSSLIVGGLLGSWWTPSKRTLGVVMAFGAGVLISAVSYELVFEAIHLAKLTGFPTMGLFAGGIHFLLLRPVDWKDRRE